MHVPCRCAARRRVATATPGTTPRTSPSIPRALHWPDSACPDSQSQDYTHVHQNRRIVRTSADADCATNHHMLRLQAQIERQAAYIQALNAQNASLLSTVKALNAQNSSLQAEVEYLMLESVRNALPEIVDDVIREVGITTPRPAATQVIAQ